MNDSRGICCTTCTNCTNCTISGPVSRGFTTLPGHVFTAIAKLPPAAGTVLNNALWLLANATTSTQRGHANGLVEGHRCAALVRGEISNNEGAAIHDFASYLFEDVALQVGNDVQCVSSHDQVENGELVDTVRRLLNQVPPFKHLQPRPVNRVWGGEQELMAAVQDGAPRASAVAQLQGFFMGLCTARAISEADYYNLIERLDLELSRR